MKKITTNQLNPIKEIYVKKILADYDIFSVEVHMDYFPSKSALLSANKSDDPTLEKIISLDFYCGNKAKTVYCLCNKEMVNVNQLREALIRYNQDLLHIHKMSEEEVVLMPQPAILQLFFNQITDAQVLEGTGLLGKLYLLSQMKKSTQNHVEFLSINEFSLNSNLAAKITTHCFTQVRYFAGKQMTPKIKKLPRYAINLRSKTIKLATNYWQANESQNYYVQAPPIRNGKPVAIPFLKLPARNRYAAFVKSKAGMLYRLIDDFNQNFGDYFSELSFKEIFVDSRELASNQSIESQNLKSKIQHYTKIHPIALVDLTKESTQLRADLIETMKMLNLKVTSASQAKNFLQLVHNRKFYERSTKEKDKESIPDPYQAKSNVQHLTVENLTNNEDVDLKSVLFNSGKELMVKNDLETGNLSFANDNQLPLQFSFFKKFQSNDSEVVLQFRFLPENKFEIRELEINDLENPFNCLFEQEENGIEIIIKDEKNGSYFQIKKTDAITLPNPEFNCDLQEYTNHIVVPSLPKKLLLQEIKNKEDYQQLIEAINKSDQDSLSFKEFQSLLDKVQLKKTAEKKLLHKLTEKYGFVLKIDSRNAWARNRYLNGLTDINYWQKDNELYYNVGTIGKGIKQTVPRASIVREISAIDSLNIEEAHLTSKDIFELINTMLVTFVKYTNLTVLPFPEKYLNEYYRLNCVK